MEMWSMPTTREVGRELARVMGYSSERIAGEKTAGFLWSQRPGYRIVSRPSETDKARQRWASGGRDHGFDVEDARCIGAGERCAACRRRPGRNARSDSRQQDDAHRLRSRRTALLLYRARQ